MQVETCAQMQIITRDADEDHTQIIRVDTVKLLGGYISRGARRGGRGVHLPPPGN